MDLVLRSLSCISFHISFLLDAQGSISIPGSMGITEVEHLSDVVYGLSDVVPMVFHFGHTSPSQNERLYRVLSAQLAKVYEERCRASAISECGECHQ